MTLVATRDSISSHTPSPLVTLRILVALAIMCAGGLLALLSGPLGAVIFLIGFGWILRQSLPWAVAIYILSAPFPLGLVLHGHKLFISDAMAIFLLIVLLVRAYRGTQNLWDTFLARPFRWPTIVLLVVSILSLATTLSHSTTLVKILEYVEFFVVVIAAMRAEGDQESSWKLYLNTLFFIVAVMGLWGLVQFLFQIGPPSNIIDLHHVRADGLFGQPNVLGGFLGDSFPLLVAFMAFGPDWARRWWYWVFLCCDAIGIIVTFSRGAWVADAAAVFFMGVVAQLRGKKAVSVKYIFPAIVIPLVMFVLGYVLGKTNLSHTLVQNTNQSSAQRIVSSVSAVVNPGKHFNTMQRLVIWKGAIHAMFKHPFLGVGLGGFHRYLTLHKPPSLHGVPPMAHNLYLEWGADLGIPGIIIALWLQWKWVATAVRNLSGRVSELSPFWFALGLGAFGTVVSFIVHNWVDFMIDHGVIVPLLLALAAIWSMWERKRRQSQES